MTPLNFSQEQKEKHGFKPNIPLALITIFGLVLAACAPPLPKGHPDKHTDPIIMDFQGTETVLSGEKDIDPILYEALKQIHPDLSRAVCLDENRPYYPDSANFCTARLYDSSNQLIETMDLPRVLPEIPSEEMSYAQKFLEWVGYPKTEEELRAQLVRMSLLEMFEKFKASNMTVGGRYLGGPLGLIAYASLKDPNHTKILLSHELAHSLEAENGVAETFVFRDPQDPSIFYVMGSSLTIIRYHIETDSNGKIAGLTANSVPVGEVFAVWLSQAFAESQGLGASSRSFIQYGLGDGDFYEEEVHQREVMTAVLNNEELRPIWIDAMLHNPETLLKLVAMAHAGAEYDEAHAIEQGFAILTNAGLRINLESADNIDFFQKEYGVFTQELRDQLWLESQKALYGDASATPFLEADFSAVADTPAFQEFLTKLYNFTTRSNEP